MSQRDKVRTQELRDAHALEHGHPTDSDYEDLCQAAEEEARDEDDTDPGDDARREMLNDLRRELAAWGCNPDGTTKREARKWK